LYLVFSFLISNKPFRKIILYIGIGMRKYIYNYSSELVNLKNSNLIELINNINVIEKLDEKKKLNIYKVGNYFQHKIKNPPEILLRLSRIQI
jgi:hypothetical protein